jgi:hypothetical protein
MPSASRNANRKRRIRRNMTLLKRAGYAEAVAKTKALVHLFAVLAQSGGEVTLTKGTIDQVVADMTKLSYSLDKAPIDGEFIMRLVVMEDKTPSTIEDSGRAVVPDVVNG